MTERFYLVPKYLEKKAEMPGGFIMSDFIPFFAGIILMFILFQFLWVFSALLVVFGGIGTYALKKVRERYPKGFLRHLLYDWGIIEVGKDLPPGRKVNKILYE
jgi:hypothetical protein